jgi:predicted DCC family thiol-disulfide oxidoreductase YuxK
MADLILLFDGACPLCRREVSFLGRRDQARHGDQLRLAFVDVDRADYDPAAHQGITYAQAMGRIHAIEADGGVLRDLAVFRRAYELIGLGWLYAPTRWPLLGDLAAAAYGLWARWRLRFTGRAGLDQLCAAREGACAITGTSGCAAVASVAEPSPVDIASKQVGLSSGTTPAIELALAGQASPRRRGPGPQEAAADALSMDG